MHNYGNFGKGAAWNLAWTSEPALAAQRAQAWLPTGIQHETGFRTSVRPLLLPPFYLAAGIGADDRDPTALVEAELAVSSLEAKRRRKMIHGFTRGFPPLKLMVAEQEESIHRGALYVLEKTGGTARTRD